jgi:hypothetical protein
MSYCLKKLKKERMVPISLMLDQYANLGVSLYETKIILVPEPNCDIFLIPTHDHKRQTGQ